MRHFSASCERIANCWKIGRFWSFADKKVGAGNGAKFTGKKNLLGNLPLIALI